MNKVTLTIDLDALGSELEVNPDGMVELLSDLIASIANVSHLSGIQCHNVDALGNFYEDSVCCAGPDWKQERECTSPCEGEETWQFEGGDDDGDGKEQCIELEGRKTLSESLTEQFKGPSLDFSSEMDEIVLTERKRSRVGEVTMPNKVYSRVDVSGSKVKWLRKN